MKDNLLVELDIGTTKICVLMAKMEKERKKKIIGIGIDTDEGVNKEVIKKI